MRRRWWLALLVAVLTATCGQLGVFDAVEQPLEDLLASWLKPASASGRVWLVDGDDEGEFPWGGLLEGIDPHHSIWVSEPNRGLHDYLRNKLESGVAPPVPLVMPDSERNDISALLAFTQPHSGERWSWPVDVDGVVRRFGAETLQQMSRMVTVEPFDLRLRYRQQLRTIPRISVDTLLTWSNPPWPQSAVFIANPRGTWGERHLLTPWGEWAQPAEMHALVAEALIRNSVRERSGGKWTWWWSTPLTALALLLGMQIVSSSLPRQIPMRISLATVAGGQVVVLLHVAAPMAVPLVTILPALWGGVVLGTLLRQQGLARQLDELSVDLGQHRAVHPLSLQPFDLAGALRHLTELLQLVGAAVVHGDRQAPLVAVTEGAAVALDGSSVNALIRRDSERLLEALGENEGGAFFFHWELDSRIVEGVVIPLGLGEGKQRHFVLVPDDEARHWWKRHRALTERLLLTISVSLQEQDADLQQAPLTPEGHLSRVETLAQWSHGDRALLLSLPESTDDGILICDPLGSELYRNTSFDRWYGALATHEHSVWQRITALCGSDEGRAREIVLQVLGEELRWRQLVILGDNVECRVQLERVHSHGGHEYLVLSISPLELAGVDPDTVGLPWAKGGA